MTSPKPMFSTVINGRGAAGNIFHIIGQARSLMRQLAIPSDKIESMAIRATKAGTYSEALAVVREWFPVQRDDDL